MNDKYKFWSPLHDKPCIPQRKSRCTWSLDADNDQNPHTELQGSAYSKEKLLPNALAAIGDTPLIKLNKIPQSEGLKCEIYAKCEYFNPAGSVKDRIALRMVEDAENQGMLKPGGTIIEPSSGNTGIGLAFVAAIKGYKMIVILPEKYSKEKESILTALGAQVIRTPNDEPALGPHGVFGAAHRLKNEIDNSIVMDQFTNPGNPLAHYDSTAQEIFDQCNGKVDMIVLGAGTGGTVTGIGRKFRHISPNTKIVASDPVGSVLAQPENLNEDDVDFFEIEGIGYKFISTVLDRSVVDTWIKTTDQEAMLMARRLIKEEGLLCGGSSGSALVAAIRAAKDLDCDKRVVVILPDGIRNYLSKFIVDQWMEERHFLPCVNTNDHWWWDKSVSMLNLQKPSSVSLNTTCENALKIMKSCGVEQLPVEEEHGILNSVLTLHNLMSGLTSKIVIPSDTISRCTIQIFPKVCQSLANLGLISRILEKEHYVIVFDTKKIDGTDYNIFIGIVTPMILLEYITTNF